MMLREKVWVFFPIHNDQVIQGDIKIFTARYVHISHDVITAIGLEPWFSFEGKSEVFIYRIELDFLKSHW